MDGNEMASVVTVLDLGHVVLPDWHPRAADEICVIQGYVIDHPDGLIVFDTGVGAGHEFIDEVYRPQVTPLIKALHEAGRDERDVVAIVNSHLHFDHCGQNAALPGAVVYAQRPELAAAEEPMFTVPEWAHIDEHRLRALHGDEEIAPGVRVLSTPGHTPGHQSLLVTMVDSPSELIVGQCCYSCAEFESGAFDPQDMHDESFVEAGTESMARLRSLEAGRVFVSHDRRVVDGWRSV